jgi:GntR family transcriptional regulator
MAEGNRVTPDLSRPHRRFTEKRERVRRHVVWLIGHTAPGVVVASERDLAAELGVSRPTVRAAIEELADEGLVIRWHGRGMFTGPPQAIADTPVAPPGVGKGFDEAGWSSRVIAFTRPLTTPSRTVRLEVKNSAPVVNVVRVLEQGGAPIAIEHLALPEDLLPGLVPADLAIRDLHRLLRERFGMVVRTARETMEPGLADPGQAELLGVDVHAPVLRAERLIRDTRDLVVALSETVYRGDRHPVTSIPGFGG